MRRGARWELGAIAIVVGGALAVAGCLLPWAVVHYSPRFLGIELTDLTSLTRRVTGTALSEGKIAVVVAVALVLFGAGAVSVRNRDWRIDLAVVAALGGLAATGVAAYAAIRIRDLTLDRYNPFLSNRPLGELHLRQLVYVSRGFGVHLAIAGGLIASAGSLIVLVRSRAAARADVSV